MTTAVATASANSGVDLKEAALQKSANILNEVGVLVKSLQTAEPQELARINALLSNALAGITGDPSYKIAFPETALSKQFQLSVDDKTKTVDGFVTGTIDVQYIIPACIDIPTAMNSVNAACACRADRPRPAIYSEDLSWYSGKESEKGDYPATERVVKYIIDFDSKDTGDGKMNKAGHRAYAQAKDAHITPIELQTLGLALYYEKTGLDLLKDYWARAFESNDKSADGVELKSHQDCGVYIYRTFGDPVSAYVVAALSPNSERDS